MYSLWLQKLCQTPYVHKAKRLLRVLLTAHVGEVSTKPMQGRRQTELMRTRHNKNVYEDTYTSCRKGQHCSNKAKSDSRK